MATLFSARLALIQAVEPVVMMANVPVAFPQALDEEITALRRREAQDYLDDVAAAVARVWVVTARASAVLGGGRSRAEFRPQHGVRSVGMIALATHGQGGLRRLVLGSIADKLVRTGELPVLVTRPRREVGAVSRSAPAASAPARPPQPA